MNTKVRKTFLILQYSNLKSTVVQYNSWDTRAGIEGTGKKSYWLEEGEGVGSIFLFVYFILFLIAVLSVPFTSLFSSLSLILETSCLLSQL